MKENEAGSASQLQSVHCVLRMLGSRMTKIVLLFIAAVSAFVLILIVSMGPRIAPRTQFVNLIEAKISNGTVFYDSRDKRVVQLFDHLIETKDHEVFLQLLASSEVARRRIGVHGLIRIGDKKSLKLLIPFLKDENDDIRGLVAVLVARRWRDSVKRELQPLLKDESRVSLYFTMTFEKGGRHNSTSSIGSLVHHELNAKRMRK